MRREKSRVTLEAKREGREGEKYTNKAAKSETHHVLRLLLSRIRGEILS